MAARLPEMPKELVLAQLEKLMARNYRSKAGCWTFSPGTSPASGYPIVSIDRVRYTVRNLMWWIFGGATLNDNQVLWAKCQNGRCVNPKCMVAVNKGYWKEPQDASQSQTAE